MSKKWVRWTVIICGGLVGLLAVAVAILYGIGTARANKSYNIAVTVPPIPSDAAAIARGEHLATTFSMCKRCHGEDLSGQLYFDAPGLVSIPTPNLTTGRGGVGSFYTDEDWVRAIRHGVGHDGRGLMLMTAKTFTHLSDADVGALIAYVKGVPPVDKEFPARKIAILGRLLIALGLFPPSAVDEIDHSQPAPPVPVIGVTAAYGEYIAHVCTECHGAQLNGMPFGPPGGEVPTPNLTPGGELAKWSEVDFINTLHSGITPAGKTMSIDMPWTYFGQMTDDELKALWLYLQSLPALPQGGL